MATGHIHNPAVDRGGEVASDQLVAGLARPETYDAAGGSVEVRETHISWVFLVGDRAYKLKKPVVLPFLDYGTVERRRRMCHEEVRLNRRLAPELYLGVRSVLSTPRGFALGDEDAQDALDYVVELRRYDEGETLAETLDRGELGRREVIALGAALARFHAGSDSVHPSGRTRTLRRRIVGDHRELLELLEAPAEIDRVLALERLTHTFLTVHEQLLERRARDGRVREGHGDLRAEHVLLGPPQQIVDCIEFDRDLRELDVADDLAFLVMDLEARGGRRFARALVDGYRDGGGDPGPDALIAFHACHRALVRAKVALLRAAQLQPGDHEHGRQAAIARELLAIAERFAWRARLPLVIVVCGVPATGKSRLARSLSRLAGLPHLSSDVTRKRLAGLQPSEHAPPDAYSEEFTARTYAELGRRAAASVAAGGGAIVDATFRHRTDRDRFRDAFAAAAPTLFVECVAPLEVLRQRAARRDRRAHASSDATLEIVIAESAAWEPLDELAPAAHLLLRSDRPVADQLPELIETLDHRLGAIPALTAGSPRRRPVRRREAAAAASASSSRDRPRPT